MLFKYGKVLVLASAIVGLCSCAQVNTTAASAARSPAPVTAPDTAGTPMPSSPAQPESTPAPLVLSVPLPVPKPMATRIALLLPLRSDALGHVADVVRAGFMAAYDQDRGRRLSVTVIETSDAVQDVVSGYSVATRDHDIVVGPLSRTGVTAIVQGGVVSKPTVALGQLDHTGDSAIMLPQKMLAIGLSVEDEARQVADWLSIEKPGARAFSISTDIAWQRRASKAFAAQWQRLGGQLETMGLGTVSGFLSADGLVQLRDRIEAEKPEFLFVALDAAQTRQLRVAIGTEVVLYGTSQLNPFALPDWSTAEPMTELNGVHLVDLPWQLQPDHPAVMIYPRLLVNPGQRRSADLERLYALGIDAYRIASEIALNRTQFELDGVTGKLKIDLDRSSARFQRTEVPAIYQDGIVLPLTGMR